MLTISPGYFSEGNDSYLSLANSEFFVNSSAFEGYYAPFDVSETINLYAKLDELTFDIDLYLGEINPATGTPESWGDGTFIIYNSSTNFGTEPETLFAQLKPGQYWLGLKVNNGVLPTSDNSKAPFRWTLDAKTFDESTILSNDPLLNRQWHLFNTGISGNVGKGVTGVTQWIAAPNVDIGAPEAWKLARDASEIIVAIIDQGVDITHPDLASNLWVNSGEIPDNGIDDDGNGYVDDINGWNFTDNSPNVVANARYQHGTNVAGIVGAQGNNALGVSGVAWDTQLMTLDVFGGAASATNVAQAVRYAVDNGAKVINMSLGYNSKLRPQDEETNKAFQYAYDRDVFVAIASGNEGDEYMNRNKWRNVGDFDLSVAAPAFYSDLFGNVASVVASNAQNQKSSFSNYGISPTISAPGGDASDVVVAYVGNQPVYEKFSETEILSTMPVGTGTVDQDYGYMAGTSQATPMISGMAALIRAQNESITAPETLAILRAGARKNPKMKTSVNQGYQADLYQSLTLAQQWNGPDTLTQIDQDQAPVLNLSFLTTAQTLHGALNVSKDAASDSLTGLNPSLSSNIANASLIGFFRSFLRKNTAYDSLIGFYRVLDAQGTVVDALGHSLRPGDPGYQSAALNAANVVNGLDGIRVDEGNTSSINYAISGVSNGMYLAPYASINGQTSFAWSAANSDGLDHFKVLGPNRFGLEDQVGGGDGDFNDIVMQFSSQQIL